MYKLDIMVFIQANIKIKTNFLISCFLQKISKNDSTFRTENGLLHTFGYNPLMCECGHEMIYNIEKSYFPSVVIGENSS